MSPNNPLASNIPLFIGAGVVLLIILGYTAFVASPYLLGPSLTVNTPVDGSTVSSPIVVVSGETARVAYLSIDDMAVPLSEDGTFEVERGFPPGYTVLVARARDRFGREAVTTIRFVNTYNPPLHVPQVQEASNSKK